MGKAAKKGKILEKLDVPQKYLMDKAADAAGVKRGKDSEETARNLVEKAAKKLGMGDSTASNAAKALGVAGLTVFADPTNLIPGAGPAKKLAKLSGKIAKTGKAARTADKATKPNMIRKASAPVAVETINTKPVREAAPRTVKDLEERLVSGQLSLQKAKNLSPEQKKTVREILTNYKKKQEK